MLSYHAGKVRAWVCQFFFFGGGQCILRCCLFPHLIAFSNFNKQKARKISKCPMHSFSFEHLCSKATPAQMSVAWHSHTAVHLTIYSQTNKRELFTCTYTNGRIGVFAPLPCSYNRRRYFQLSRDKHAHKRCVLCRAKTDTDGWGDVAGGRPFCVFVEVRGALKV